MSEVSARWPVVALAGLAAVAPFNIKIYPRPWTDLQLRGLIGVGLLVALAITVHGLARPHWRRPDHVEWISFGWLVAVWISALTSADVALGAGGAARLSVVILLIPATRTAVRAAGDAVRILQALAVGTVLAALVGLTYWLWSDSLDPTRVFVGKVTSVGPFVRLTRPWAHANIAAMAIGATIASVTMLKRRSLVAASLVLLTVALVLTISRGGMAAGLAVGLAWLVLTRSPVSVISFGAILAMAAVVFALSSAWTVRIDQFGDSAFYASSVEAPASITLDPAGGEAQLTVVNRSATVWPHRGDDRVVVSARWVGDDGLIWAEELGPLPQDLSPGESLAVPFRLEASVPAGEYTLRWDLLISDTAYFGQFLGDEPILTTATVATSEVTTTDIDPYSLVARTVSVDRRELWQLAWDDFVDSPLFGVGPNQFAAGAADELEDEGRRAGAHAHNIVLEPLATWGLAGALPFLVLLGGAFIHAGRRAWATKDSVATVLAVSLVGIGVHGLVDWPLVAITTGIPIGLVVGLAWSPLALHRSEVR